MDFQQTEKRLSELLSRRFLKRITQEEEKELQELMELPEVREFVEKMDDDYIQQQLLLRNDIVDIVAIREKVKKMIFNPLRSTQLAFWKKLAIAASVILVFFSGAYLFNHSVDKDNSKADENRLMVNDIFPPAGLATLTLSNGRKINLSTAGDEKIIDEKVEIKNGLDEIVYSKVLDFGKEVINTLSTSKGGTYKLKLADGSIVWLNSGSSIRFPAAFVKNTREVEIEGEAYFEIAKDKAKPFIVISNRTRVEVLGTRFNVNAYNTEPSINTTLIQGSVKVYQDGQEKILKPGDQSQSGIGKITVVNNVDFDEVIAWQQNEFIFRLRTVPEIMRQLQQYYDFEVDYVGTVRNDKFVARFNRSSPLSRVLEILQQTGKVNFVISGKKVKVEFK